MVDDLSELIRSQLIWLTIPGEPGLGSGRPLTVHPLEASQEGLAAALGAMSTQALPRSRVTRLGEAGGNAAG